MSDSEQRPLVGCRGLWFWYPGSARPLLSDINLEVRPGDRVLIRGDSGRGKSTLLLILAGMVPEHVAGRLEGELVRTYRGRGLVMQNPEAQVVTPTVEEEVAFAPENAGLPSQEIRRRVDDLLSDFGLFRMAARHPLDLSGGECQRVSLASALAARPEVLFLDEPTSYLDAEATRAFFAALERLDDRVAVVMVEHRIGLAARICRRAVELDSEGRLSLSNFEVAGRGYEGIEARAVSIRDDSRTSEAVVEVRGFVAGYGKPGKAPPVLDGVDLDLFPGEVTVIEGKSGSGKSTLLSAISGGLAPLSGEVRVGGLRVGKLSPKELARWLILVPQNPEHFFLADTVAEELGLAGSESEILAREFGIVHLSNRHPFRLSEGEKRRLSLAIAARRPVVLLDEPTYGLDAASSATAAKMVRELARAGSAVLIATHDRDLAAAVADHLLVLEAGRLAAREAVLV